ncbi:hypothetical protein J1605_004339 [Eschrichtius robustus]|uniref:Golgin subfamily A member 7 n=1 Tax=Eschrichtius robustus TaxID=9764 RepID=A0AB34HIN1_ESCRO|nr:hypothetical protein J1605_004339 [Eschrichtius robustus]
MRPQQAPVSGKVFIQRDYSSGTRCQFQTKFPAELENREGFIIKGCARQCRQALNLENAEHWMGLGREIPQNEALNLSLAVLIAGSRLYCVALQIDRQQFEETVRTLNNLYAEAEKLGGQSYLEGCLACLTAYTIFLCMETHYEKVLKKVSKYIQEQNEKIYAPQGLLLTDPIERGLRVVSFQPRSRGLNICKQNLLIGPVKQRPERI